MHFEDGYSQNREAIPPQRWRQTEHRDASQNAWTAEDRRGEADWTVVPPPG
jgi:hypothetical protein